MRSNDQHGGMRIAIALLSIVALAGLGWGAFSFLWPKDDGQIAMLKADAAPYKVRPDEAGGMQIPHQDKQVFSAVSSEGKVVTVERILPAPEKPVLPQTSSVIAEAAALTQAQVAQQQAVLVPVSTPQPEQPPMVAMGRAVDAPQAAEPAPSLALDPSVVARQGAKAVERGIDAPSAFDGTKMDVALPVQKPQHAQPEAKAQVQKAIDNRAKSEEEQAAAEEQEETAPEAAQTEEAPEEKKTEVSEEKPRVASSGGRFQLASFFDRPSAERAIKKFNNSYASALGGADLFIVEATIPGKGKVFRVQGNGDASAVCGQVKAKGGTCVSTR